MMLMQTKQTKVKTVSIVIFITLIGKIFGLGRDVLLGQSFGTGYTADALMVASLIPRQFFDVVFAGAIGASFIPILSDVFQKGGKAEANALASSFFTLVGLFALSFSVFAFVFSAQIIALTANFDPETHLLAARLLRIIFPSLFFTGIAFSFVGFLQTFGEFKVPAAISVFSNGILIIYLLFFTGRFGVYGAAFAMLLGWAAQAFVQIPALKKQGFSYRLRLWHPEIKNIGKLMLPVMLSTWVFPVNMLIMLSFASRFLGGASSIGFANSLYLMVVGIFVLSVTNVIFPELSRLSDDKTKAEFTHLVRKTTRTLLFFLIPMTVGVMLLSTPLVRLLYQRQEFTAHSTALTSSALFYLCIGMVGFGLLNLFTRVFYAQKRGGPPIIAGITSILTTVLLCFLLVDHMAIAGLGLASGISLLVGAGILAVFTHKTLDGGLFANRFFVDMFKMLFSAAVMGILVFFLRNFFASILDEGMLGRLLLVALPALFGIATYFFLAYVLQLEEIHFLRKLLGREARP